MNIIEGKQFSNFSALKLTEKTSYYCELSSIEEIDAINSFVKERNLPVLFLGEGTNIVTTKDYEGLVVKNKLFGIYEKEDYIIEVASGENWHEFVEWSLLNDKFGLENLALIPGTVGAAPVQNIGAYGSEISNYIKEVSVYNLGNNTFEVMDAKACKFGYRKSIFQKRTDLIILSVTFELNREPKINYSYDSLKKEIQKRGITLNDLRPQDIFKLVSDIRNKVLPNYIELPNVGSFFKNTELSKTELDKLNLSPNIPVFKQGNVFKISSAFLIEEAGWKGHQKGAIGISDIHSLVLITYEEISGKELINFANEIIEDIFYKTGIKLEIEPTVL
tara:strand:- start:65 stop:1063 length:999 start_codon:yes stop_codon:yes gene_type:complete